MHITLLWYNCVCVYGCILQDKLKEREREMRKRKEREEQEMERVRLKVRRKEAISSYQALLVETIKDPKVGFYPMTINTITLLV